MKLALTVNGERREIDVPPTRRSSQYFATTWT